MHDYARFCEENTVLMDTSRPAVGKVDAVRLCARYSANVSARCVWSPSLSVSAVCLLKFQECVPFQCVVAWTDHRLYPVSISGCDYTFWDCRFNVQVCLHHSSSAIWVAQNSKKKTTTSTMSEVGRWPDSRYEATVVTEYKISSRSITSPMSQIDTQWVGEMFDLLFPEITRLRSAEQEFLDLTCNI